jgi:alpha-L-fucosidase
MRTSLALLLALLLASSRAPAQSPPAAEFDQEEVRKIVAEMLADAQTRSSLLNPGRMDWWREARFGMFIHWGLYAIPAGEWGGETSYGEWIRSSAKIPRDEYAKLQAKFNPTAFNAREWVRLAKQAGMKYITITTKHHDGFCLWDSATTEWDVMGTPFKRDILKEMAEACRDEGIRLCFYYSIMDWHHPDYVPRRDWETEDTKGADFERYVAYMKAQLKELLTNYGPIGVLWFDGQWEGSWNDERGRDLDAYVRSLQPSIIINSRVGRSGGAWGLDAEGGMLGDYATPEQAIPDEVPAGVDWETCMTMNGHWGYNRADKDFKSTQDLVRKLADIAGKGGNFLLNVGPTAEGKIPEESVERLRGIGAWMAVNAESIQGTRAGSLGKPSWGRTTERTLPGGVTRVYLHVFERPADGRLVVPGLLNTPVRSYVLGRASLACDVERDGQDVAVEPAAFESNGIDDVLVLEIEGAPDVMKPPVITAPSLVFVDHMNVGLSSTQQNVEIRYTLDGTEPRADSPVAGAVVMVRDSGIISARSFRGDKPVSPVAQLAVSKAVVRPGVVIENTKRGVRYEYFESGGPGPNGGVDMKSVDDLRGMQPVKTGRAALFDPSVRMRDKHWGVRFSGYIEVTSAGVYRFSVGSDDGSRLLIGDEVVVSNDGPHSYQVQSGDIALGVGMHPITVEFFENTGGFDLKVFWSPPPLTLESKREPVPTERLCAP